MPYSIQATFYSGSISDFSYLQAIFISHGSLASGFATTDLTLTNLTGGNNYFKDLGWGGWLSFQYDAVSDGWRGSVILYDSYNDVVMSVLSIQPSIDEYPARILGLVGGNQVVRDQVLDGNGNLTSANIRIYDTAAHASTDDGTTGLLRTYTLTNSYTGSNLTKQTTTG